jgi:hypothetical protein
MAKIYVYFYILTSTEKWSGATCVKPDILLGPVLFINEEFTTKNRCYYYYLILFCRRETLQSRMSLFQSGGLGTYHISNILLQIFLDLSINSKKLRFLELRPPPPPFRQSHSPLVVNLVSDSL